MTKLGILAAAAIAFISPAEAELIHSKGPEQLQTDIRNCVVDSTSRVAEVIATNGVIEAKIVYEGLVLKVVFGSDNEGSRFFSATSHPKELDGAAGPAPKESPHYFSPPGENGKTGNSNDLETFHGAFCSQPETPTGRAMFMS